MLVLFLLHIIISFSCLSAGFIFYHTYNKITNEKAPYRGIIFYLITGLITLTMLTQIIALFFPVGYTTQLIVGLAVFFILWLQKKEFTDWLRRIYGELATFSRLTWICLVIFWLLILIINAGPTLMDDTESYHIQMVRWIKEYGSVPGLVHLHERYGFNSSWFSTIALFNVKYGHQNYYTALNGVLSLWLVLYLLSLLNNAKGPWHGNFSLAAMVLLLVVSISWPLLRGNPGTCNYDYITMLLIIVLFVEMLRTVAAGVAFQPGPEWLVWPAYLFTVRITNFPLLLLTLFAIVFLLLQQRRKIIFPNLFFCILLVLPFLARNLLLSGYPLYPSLAFDWFNPDWKADHKKTTELLHFIKYFNRVNTGLQPIEYTESLAFPKWIISWFRFMFTYDKIIFIPGMIGLFSFPFLAKRNPLFSSLAVRFFVLVIGMQLILWFLVAPDPRFIYGCLLAGICIIIFSFRPADLSRKFKPVIISIFLAVISVFVGGFAIFKIQVNQPAPGWITPKPLPEPGLQTVKVDGVAMYIPEKIGANWNPRCYDTDLPCLYMVDPRIMLRHKTIQGGFRLRP